MNGDPRIEAGAAFASQLADDPRARAAWERARARLQILAQAQGAAHRRDDREAALAELADAIRDALRATDRELEASGFEPPRTLEDWEHLAYLAEMPFETIQTGNFTLAHVRAVALAWADRERMKARIAAEARGTDTAATARSDADVADDKSDPPALTATEAAVLRTLADFDPSELASAARIEAAMESDARLAERSILPAVRRLIELGLAECPQGIRSGARLTLAGRRLARKIAG